MASTRNYSIKKNRLKTSCMENMELKENGTVVCNADAGVHNLFLDYLDGGVESCQWGRFHFTGRFAENAVVIVRVGVSDQKDFIYQGELMGISDFLLDPQQPAAEKKKLFHKMNSVKLVNRTDMLLYTLEGRYLWIYLEVLGTGESTLENLQVNMEGDNFMFTFPEIYQERNSFFHRYLSVFSSIYNDFQDNIDNLADLMDIDTAPVQLLPVFGRWLGIDLDEDMLEEKKLRLLLKEAYQLNRHKGTVAAIKRIIEIVLEQEVTIVEKSRMQGLIPYEDKDIYEKLYGDNSYDITVLMKGRENQNEKARLKFLLDQFTPLRTRINLVFLEERGMLDSYCYLDSNASIYEYKPGNLDQGEPMDGTRIL